MKKIIHNLILSIALLGFAYPLRLPTLNTKAAPKQVHNVRPSHTTIITRPAAVADGDWQIETVDSEVVINSVSLQLDSNGYPHLAYTADYLNYAWNDGANWRISKVDETTHVGSRVSLALDGQGYAHISYYDASNADLKYAFKDESGWNIKTVDHEGDVGHTSSLALDMNGYPHISYIGGKTSEEWNLKYAHLDETGWHISTVDRGGIETGIGNSLVLDKNGNPHISYLEFHTYGPVGSTLKYAYLDSNGWQIENIAGAEGGETSLGLDGNGRSHIIYPSNVLVMYAGLSYTYQDEDGWHDSLIAGGTQYHYNSLVMDKFGNPHITYVSGMYKVSFKVIYAKLDNFSWRLYPVDFLAHYDISGGDNSLALDINDSPHISYIDETGQNLMYAYRITPFTIYDYHFLPLVAK